MQYRDLVNRFASYEQQLRDRQIDLNGVSTTFTVAGEGEATVDYFGDQVMAPANFTYATHIVIPDYAKYYMLIGMVGETDEAGNDLPLEVHCETTAFIPVGSTFPLPVRSGDGVIRTEYWRVQASMVQHVDVLYGKVLTCVPARLGPTGQAPTTIPSPGAATYTSDPTNFPAPVSS